MAIKELEDLLAKTMLLQDAIDKADISKVGEIINMLFDVRQVKDQIRIIEKSANVVKEQIEEKIIALLQDEGLSKAESEKGSVSITAGIYPSVDDKEAFTRWVVSENRFDMLQKRCSAPSIMEFFNLENKLPDGIKTFDKIKLNIRTK